MPASSRISPTAHYTGHVWLKNGLSDPAFATREGARLHLLLSPFMAGSRALGGPTIDAMLLARHRLIDRILERAIDDGEIGQVIEVAAGLSPRGWRFRNRYGDRLTYVEADLPGMLAHKRRILGALGGEDAHHRTVEVDALADGGATSIDAICRSLDPALGTAIITEGLINYFDTPTVIGMWRRFAAALRRFPRGLYLSDLILRAGNHGALATGFQWLLSAFVRGRVHTHFDSAAEADAAFAEAGLRGALLDPREFTSDLPDLERAGAGRVRIIEARPA